MRLPCLPGGREAGAQTAGGFGKLCPRSPSGRAGSGALELPLALGLPSAPSRLSARKEARSRLPEGGCQTCSQASTVGAVLRVGGQRHPRWRRGEVSQASRAPARPGCPKFGRLGSALLLLPPPPPNPARKNSSRTCPHVSPDWRAPRAPGFAVHSLRPQPLWPHEDVPGPRGEITTSAPAGRSLRVSGDGEEGVCFLEVRLGCCTCGAGVSFLKLGPVKSPPRPSPRLSFPEQPGSSDVPAGKARARRCPTHSGAAPQRRSKVSRGEGAVPKGGGAARPRKRLSSPPSPSPPGFATGRECWWSLLLSWFLAFLQKVPFDETGCARFT